MHLTADRKKEIFTAFGGSETNTGSTEAQIAMFTERINFISAHLKEFRKDKSAELSLIKLVGKRRSLLNYLMKNDIFKYRALIKELGLRKQVRSFIPFTIKEKPRSHSEAGLFI